MITKIVNKFIFIIKIANLGYGYRSKITLLYNTTLITTSLFKKHKSAFTAWIGSGNGSFFVSFTGTVDEIHALDEIYIKEYYFTNIRPSTILDLGANIGLSVIWFKMNFPASIVHAYEPNPYIFKILEQNVKNISGVRVYNQAVTGDNSKIQINISDRSFSSSIYKIENGRPITVETVSLDDAINKIGGNVDLLKIDIEGAEFPAIKSSTLLSKVNTIVGEIHPEKAGEPIESMITDIQKTHRIEKIGKDKSIFLASLVN